MGHQYRTSGGYRQSEEEIDLADWVYNGFSLGFKLLIYLIPVSFVYAVLAGHNLDLFSLVIGPALVGFLLALVVLWVRWR
ncbi:hypothetical protein [Halorussus ruber]|uniref:hypothetical protein n=1 Tax=Halorussus ruber TaxID=1126238 RepID=UPI001092C3A1|nr:hypothetical protein [Halorussus ruber]